MNIEFRLDSKLPASDLRKKVNNFLQEAGIFVHIKYESVGEVAVCTVTLKPTEKAKG